MARKRVLILLLALVTWPVAGDERNRDFDFEFGAWNAQISRLKAPLSGSQEWVEYTGTSVVRPVWNGRANLGELSVAGEGGRIEGMSLRVFDPAAGKWRIHWTNARDGMVGEAMVGGFTDGVGTFYNEEEYDGRTVIVRFLFSEITDRRFRLEQAFSPDGGATWEPNWIAQFGRADAAVAPDASAAGAWAALDAAWNARDAEAFSESFTEGAILAFVDRDSTFDGRAAIRAEFVERFPKVAASYSHHATVTRTRAVAHGVLAVDGIVEVRRNGQPFRTFWTFSVLVEDGSRWRFREMRVFQQPDASVP